MWYSLFGFAVADFFPLIIHGKVGAMVGFQFQVAIVILKVTKVTIPLLSMYRTMCRRARGRIDPDLDSPDPDSPH